METAPEELNRLLVQFRSGDKDAEARIFQVVYHELRRVAANCLRRERPNHTLQPTALVNEACLKLLARARWSSREQFFAVAARAMRQVLVDYARERKAEKRGGELPKLQLNDVFAAAEEPSAGLNADQLEEVVLVSAAVDQLAEEHPRQARVVEYRFFGGLTVEETGRMLGINTRSVNRDWAFARAWLRRKLSSTQ
jgi:RNA polymerase sigma factor (TIGR02999 family)